MIVELLGGPFDGDRVEVTYRGPGMARVFLIPGPVTDWTKEEELGQVRSTRVVGTYSGDCELAARTGKWVWQGWSQ